MSVSANTVITRTRTEIVMDTDASNYRWPDVVMVDYANQTVREILANRPHLLIDAQGAPMNGDDVVEGVTLAALSSATWPLPAHYEEAIMHGVAMRCFLQDSSDQSNAARASYELSRFRECAGIRTQAATTTAQ